MGYYGIEVHASSSLSHHGIKGQKWGVRRYQNADGSLTAEGRKRYGQLEKRINSGNFSTKDVSEYRALYKANKKATRKAAVNDKINNIAKNKPMWYVHTGAQLAGLGLASRAVASLTMGVPAVSLGAAAVGDVLVAAGGVSLGAAGVSYVKRSK